MELSANNAILTKEVVESLPREEEIEHTIALQGKIVEVGEAIRSNSTTSSRTIESNVEDNGQVLVRDCWDRWELPVDINGQNVSLTYSESRGLETENNGEVELSDTRWVDDADPGVWTLRVAPSDLDSSDPRNSLFEVSVTTYLNERPKCEVMYSSSRDFGTVSDGSRAVRYNSSDYRVAIATLDELLTGLRADLGL